MTLHAHVTTRSRDCDGEYRRGHTDHLTLEERISQFGDLEFKERVIGTIISLHAIGTLEITPSGVTWHEVTDEGYSSACVDWCEDDCGDGGSWQRDLSAERAGY